jgi:asparagine synthase (glutamine-hydrolysing)
VCGINGIVRLDSGLAPASLDELRRVRDRMALRGPDGTGEWLSKDGSVALGHRRLAIIDLSDAALQPMSWDGGRYRIVFNGEIYNYRELRSHLLSHGVPLRTHSDTEVLLALFARDGADALRRLRGMYALAIWDDRARRLFLARDPHGIKPLYYATDRGYFRFASQVRALEASGAVSKDPDPAGAVGFLLWGSVPEPRTIRKDIRALPAGSYLFVEDGALGEPRMHDALAEPHGDEPLALGDALEASVRAHLESDVPVAVFLSSGIDSSLIAALARRSMDGPPTTLTLGFDRFLGTPQDEGPLAAEVARVLGTKHVHRVLRREEFLGLWPAALRAMDQPSIDGFNTFVISRAAHEAGFKVVLSGLGGDEIFGGYESFTDVPSWARTAGWLRRIPGVPSAWPRLARIAGAARPKMRGFVRFGGTLAGAYFLRRGLFLPEEIPEILGDGLASEGLAAYDPIRDAAKALSPASHEDPWVGVHRMESSMYLRNQLLRDSDWASMAHSLELRVPFVDAWLERSLARAGYEPARSAGKAGALRGVAPELPDALWSRPKTGFAIPVVSWLAEDPEGPSTPGLDSRRLALRVLAEFGVPVESREMRWSGTTRAAV